MSTLDSHLHLWDPCALRYDWLRELPALNRPFLPAQLAEDAQSPKAAIVVQADCAAQQALQEVAWINQLAENSPIELAGIVAWAPLDKGSAVAPYLRHLRELPRVVGIRRSLQNEPLDLFYRADYREGLLAAAREGFVLDICVRASQLTALYDLLAWLYQRAPETQVVLEHMGKPAIADNRWPEWREAFTALAGFPHLACKISGLPTEADWQSWQPEQLRPWIQLAITVFGPQRCLFGGDWPVVELAGGYARWQACVQEAIAHLTLEEINAVMGENARRIYLTQSAGGNI
ncbi:amidohydrolase family protein [Klebsiella oxytoca]|jgi:L-fuconolactonase|uniref:amidohydrolase family protein n=2 Tax=Klebsiella TaxID=570 RepID=UPI0013D4656E|nr:amidohydrolase family protein [Klebsiella oxytoca]EIX9036837.1 amidohydrolase family protein [Klebsiella oxytoca]EIZ1084193.1 amidohydrolase family protein [Klebsiella oxytoca]EKY0605641.1 amidohydrolase family protein [Klebsiella oxytoca]ELK0735833.1 amidohydrolase family protein [Klebsiella oxytoca]ELW9511673.1 amidohydrolase family protein [Klebsiella oxytoca]